MASRIRRRTARSRACCAPGRTGPAGSWPGRANGSSRWGRLRTFPPGETEEAGFLAAADALLAIAPMRRTLTATAYPNRWLVVRDLGSAGQ